MGIAAAAAGQQPAEVGSAGGVLAPHQGQHAGTFRQHESVSVKAVGTRGLVGGVVAAGQSPHR